MADRKQAGVNQQGEALTEFTTKRRASSMQTPEQTTV